MMHLAKKDAIADDDNINDLIYLSNKYLTLNGYLLTVLEVILLGR